MLGHRYTPRSMHIREGVIDTLLSARHQRPISIRWPSVEPKHARGAFILATRPSRRKSWLCMDWRAWRGVAAGRAIGVALKVTLNAPTRPLQPDRPPPLHPEMQGGNYQKDNMMSLGPAGFPTRAARCPARRRHVHLLRSWYSRG